ncbi:MAG: flavodoxin [Erysipelotrichaceae bacterium]|nr:flavodoxin [Erysipelotrichaceae bacterium]
MQKGIILYQSKYGASEQYAHMLSKRCGYACAKLKDHASLDLDSYHTLIIVSGVYAGGMAGSSILRKQYAKWKHHPILLLAVGASPYDESALAQLRKQTHLPEDIALFYARGTWNLKNMTLVDRSLCKLLLKTVHRKKDEATEPWMRALLETGEKEASWISECYLEKLLKHLKEHSLL